MAAAEVMDRLDTLLQGLDPAVTRPLSSPLVKLHGSAETPEEWLAPEDPAVCLGYLALEGGQSRYPSHEVGSSLRNLPVVLTLVAYHGGMTGVTQKRDELERTLVTAWECIESVLTWPANLSRGTTGWWSVTGLSASPNSARGDRLVKPCRFTAIYLYTHAEA